ncbi:hypothetical protein B0H17DRAFT_1215886 [Mycena rosella]|uniref:Uncharacterized protein n=1 Tax=Mycena rosella TaxID=1033263 RepID=A0AAD7CD71_MYCRO|nr:hypothetical protein B0H17DRAFT_1215886 [Mycena rosella]
MGARPPAVVSLGRFPCTVIVRSIWTPSERVRVLAASPRGSDASECMQPRALPRPQGLLICDWRFTHEHPRCLLGVLGTRSLLVNGMRPTPSHDARASAARPHSYWCCWSSSVARVILGAYSRRLSISARRVHLVPHPILLVPYSDAARPSINVKGVPSSMSLVAQSSSVHATLDYEVLCPPVLVLVGASNRGNPPIARRSPFAALWTSYLPWQNAGREYILVLDWIRWILFPPGFGGAPKILVSSTRLRSGAEGRPHAHAPPLSRRSELPTIIMPLFPRHLLSASAPLSNLMSSTPTEEPSWAALAASQTEENDLGRRWEELLWVSTMINCRSYGSSTCGSRLSRSLFQG